jgi:hypothetical protein
MANDFVDIAAFLKRSQKLCQKQRACLPDDAVCALAKLFSDIVTLVNDEILIEHLEDLSALEICHLVAAITIVFLKVGEYQRRLCACKSVVSWRPSNRS